MGIFRTGLDSGSIGYISKREEEEPPTFSPRLEEKKKNEEESRAGGWLIERGRKKDKNEIGKTIPQREEEER